MEAVKTVSQLMAETLRYFAEDPITRRSAVGGTCTYFSEDPECSKGCFVGIFIDDKDMCKAMDEHETGIMGAMEVTNVKDELLFAHKMPAIIVDNISTFSDFQTLHDKYEFWDNSKEGMGLTRSGKEYLEVILECNDTLNKEDFKEFL